MGRYGGDEGVWRRRGEFEEGEGYWSGRGGVDRRGGLGRGEFFIC